MFKVTYGYAHFGGSIKHQYVQRYNFKNGKKGGLIKEQLSKTKDIQVGAPATIETLNFID